MEDRGSIPSGDYDGIFSLRHCVHTRSGSHPTSRQMGTGGSFPEDKEIGG